MQFETNFFAPLRLSKLVAVPMAERRSGLIVNIGSIVGESALCAFREPTKPSHRTRISPGNIPTPWSGVYSASKAALHSISETLRMEVKGLGIDVMLVAPGAITSQFGKKQLNSFQMPEGARRGFSTDLSRIRGY